MDNHYFLVAPTSRVCVKLYDRCSAAHSAGIDFDRHLLPSVNWQRTRSSSGVRNGGSEGQKKSRAPLQRRNGTSNRRHTRRQYRHTPAHPPCRVAVRTISPSFPVRPFVAGRGPGLRVVPSPVRHAGSISVRGLTTVAVTQEADALAMFFEGLLCECVVRRMGRPVEARGPSCRCQRVRKPD